MIHRDPSARQSAAGDQTVQMEVLREILSPRVQNRRDPDCAAEMPRVSPEGEERIGGRAEEKRVDHARIALRERVEVVRQGEDDVEVRNGQQVGAPRREPPLFGEGLTLRTMPIATGVIGDPHSAAAVTRLPMAAEHGGAAGRDRPQGSVLHRREPVRASIGVAVVADDVRQLEPRTGDRVCRASLARRTRSALRRRREARQEIERRVRTDLRVTRQLKVPRGRADVAVAEQALNRVDVDAGLEQVRRKGVTEPVDAAWFGDPRAQLRRLIRPLKRTGMPSAARSLETETATCVGAPVSSTGEARRANAACSTVYRSLPPLPCSTRIVIRAESMSVTRRCKTSFSRKPAA